MGKYLFLYFPLSLICGVAKKFQSQKGVMNEKSLRRADLDKDKSQNKQI